MSSKGVYVFTDIIRRAWQMIKLSRAIFTLKVLNKIVADDIDVTLLFFSVDKTWHFVGIVYFVKSKALFSLKNNNKKKIKIKLSFARLKLARLDNFKLRSPTRVVQ